MVRRRKKVITLEDLAAKVARGFEETATKEDIKKLDGRMDKLEGRMDKLEFRMVKLEENQLDMKLRLDNVVYRYEMEDLKNRVKRLEQKTGLTRGFSTIGLGLIIAVLLLAGAGVYFWQTTRLPVAEPAPIPPPPPAPSGAEEPPTPVPQPLVEFVPREVAEWVNSLPSAVKTDIEEVIGLRVRELIEDTTVDVSSHFAHLVCSYHILQTAMDKLSPAHQASYYQKVSWPAREGFPDFDKKTNLWFLRPHGSGELSARLDQSLATVHFMSEYVQYAIWEKITSTITDEQRLVAIRDRAGELEGRLAGLVVTSMPANGDLEPGEFQSIFGADPASIPLAKEFCRDLPVPPRYK